MEDYITTSITLDDIAGLERQKAILQDMLILPMSESKLYTEMIIEPSKIKERKNFLFYGPPGTGKTYLARGLAGSCNLDFTSVQSTQLLQRYVGEGAQSVRNLYESTSGIIFIDEIDAIAGKRNEFNAHTSDVLLQLMMMLDSMGGDYNLSTIMATNRVDSIDDALLSRIPVTNRLYFPVPDKVQREKIITQHLSYHRNEINDISKIVDLTNNYNGRDIEDIFALARRNALKAKRSSLEMEDFKIEKTRSLQC